MGKFGPDAATGTEVPAPSGRADPGKRLRAVLLDHDGTLVDSEQVHFDLWTDLLAAHCVPLPRTLYTERYAGLPTMANAIDMVERFGLEMSAQALAHAKGEATRAYLDRQAFPLMPGALEVIERWRRQGLALAVVTGAGAKGGVRETLLRDGLRDSVAVVVTGDDVKFSKPAPDGYVLAVRALALDPAECLAVEDTQHGLEAAHAAGLRCVVVPNSMSSDHDFRRAHAVVPNLLEVDRLVQQLIGAGTQDDLVQP